MRMRTRWQGGERMRWKEGRGGGRAGLIRTGRVGVGRAVFGTRARTNGQGDGWQRGRGYRASRRRAIAPGPISIGISSREVEKYYGPERGENRIGAMYGRTAIHGYIYTMLALEDRCDGTEGLSWTMAGKLIRGITAGVQRTGLAEMAVSSRDEQVCSQQLALAHDTLEYLQDCNLHCVSSPAQPSCPRAMEAIDGQWRWWRWPPMSGPGRCTLSMPREVLWHAALQPHVSRSESSSAWSP